MLLWTLAMDLIPCSIQLRGTFVVVLSKSRFHKWSTHNAQIWLVCYFHVKDHKQNHKQWYQDVHTNLQIRLTTRLTLYVIVSNKVYNPFVMALFKGDFHASINPMAPILLENKTLAYQWQFFDMSKGHYKMSHLCQIHVTMSSMFHLYKIIILSKIIMPHIGL